MSSFYEKLKISANMVLRLIDLDGKIVFEKRFHNVFTNHGRTWLARSNRVKNTSPWARLLDCVPFYMTVGIGSDQQTANPPGPGSQTESPSVTHLEEPVKIDANNYLKEIERPTLEPDDFTNQYRCTFLETEISFGSSLSVPISEAGLVTSDANPANPGGYKAGSYDNGYLIAYRTFPPITKTQLFRFQIIWEFRF